MRIWIKELLVGIIVANTLKKSQTTKLEGFSEPSKVKNQKIKIKVFTVWTKHGQSHLS